MLNATMYYVHNCVYIETTKALRAGMGWLDSIQVFPWNIRLSNMTSVIFLMCGFAFGLMLTHIYALISNIIVRQMFWGILNDGIVFLHWIVRRGTFWCNEYWKQNMFGSIHLHNIFSQLYSINYHFNLIYPCHVISIHFNYNLNLNSKLNPYVR